jgi:hypothetical protein
MHRRRWRFYETPTGAKPVQAFLDNLTATEVAEVVVQGSVELIRIAISQTIY